MRSITVGGGGSRGLSDIRILLMSSDSSTEERRIFLREISTLLYVYFDVPSWG